MAVARFQTFFSPAAGNAGRWSAYKPKHHAMNHCQICAQKPYISFGWEIANEGKDQELARLADHLRPIRALKFGHLYQCPVSQNYWYLNDDRSLIYSVPPDKVELLWQWDRQSLVLTDTQINALSKIGAPGSAQDAYGRSEIEIPCKISRTRDEVYDPVLALITKFPPIQYWRKKVLLGNPRDSMTHSDLALPISVRNATRNAREINMGYAPTLVKSADDQYFVLSGAKHIFSYGHLKGKDISLGDRAFQRGDLFPIINEPIEQITFFYYDWYEDCHKLVQQSAG